MHFGFTLELSDIDLWNIDLLDTHIAQLEKLRYKEVIIT